MGALLLDLVCAAVVVYALSGDVINVWNHVMEFWDDFASHRRLQNLRRREQRFRVHLLDADAELATEQATARRQMNEAAGQSWRNLTE